MDYRAIVRSGYGPYGTMEPGDKSISTGTKNVSTIYQVGLWFSKDSLRIVLLKISPYGRCSKDSPYWELIGTLKVVTIIINHIHRGFSGSKGCRWPSIG